MEIIGIFLIVIFIIIACGVLKVGLFIFSILFDGCTTMLGCLVWIILAIIFIMILITG